jgi:hypothetical protein
MEMLSLFFAISFQIPLVVRDLEIFLCLLGPILSLNLTLLSTLILPIEYY